MLQALPWLLLAVVLALWGLAAYACARRVARARLQLGRAQRQTQAVQRDLAGIREQLEAERGLVDRFPDPVIVFAPDRSALRWNAAAETAFGRDMAALLRHPSFRGALERAQTQGADQFAELSLPVPIARELHASVLALPAEQAGPRLVAVLSDRTRDQAVERMRADFVANASHELRTPLTSLIGFIDTLRGAAADDPEAQQRFLGIMADQALRMNRLIDDLLSLSRIELTEHLPPSGRVAVADLIARMAASFQPLLEARQTTLATDVAPDLPEIPGDEAQLEQVLQNLLDNALKYGREGGTIRVLAQNGQNGVVIKVQDDGRGIPRAHIPRLTERFYRVDAHRSREVGGTGLGLAIVKHIVNRHRGLLGIDSTEAVGTTVQVWLPT